MRGYKKTADGKTTSYFHTEISEEAKKLIEAQGFGKPQKLEAPTEESDATPGSEGCILGWFFFWKKTSSNEERQFGTHSTM